MPDLVDKYTTRYKTLMSNFSMWALGVNESVCSYVMKHDYCLALKRPTNSAKKPYTTIAHMEKLQHVHTHIMHSHMRMYSKVKECAKTTGFALLVNSIVDLAISHMHMWEWVHVQ